MKTHTRNILIVIGFWVVLMIPILTINKIQGKKSDNENRFLAEFPVVFTDAGKVSADFTTKFEDWFNDNIGFRESLVKLSSSLQFHILKKTPGDQVEQGRDGWFFYKKNHNLDMADGEYPIEEMLPLIGHHQQRIFELLREQGITYVLVLPASKVSIYPEKIASGTYSVIKTPCEIVAEYLQKNTEVPVILLKNDLLKAKPEGQLYFKTDTHWNERGAYYAYRSIVEQLKTMGIVVNDPVEVTYENSTFKGEFSRMMGNQMLLPAEATVVTKIKEPHAQEITSGSRYDLTEEYKQKAGINNPSYMFTNKQIQGPKILWYGDSLFGGWNLPNLLAENAEEFTYIWSYQISQEEIDVVNPNVLIYNIGERYLDILPEYNRDFLNVHCLSNPLADIEKITIEQDRGTYNVSVTVRNVGKESWDYFDGIKMCVWSPKGDTGIRAMINGQVIHQNETYTFNFEGIEKSLIENGEIQMVQEGYAYFGERLKLKDDN